MPRTKHSEQTRTYSRYGREAVVVLGQLIRINRIGRKLSVAELASRVGASRDLIQRIEKGDPRCGIGLAFEAAAVVGVSLFDENRERLTILANEQEKMLQLLPKSVRQKTTVVKDDF